MSKLQDPRDAIIAHQAPNMPDALVVMNTSVALTQALPTKTITGQSFDATICALTNATPQFLNGSCIVVRGTKQREETLALIAVALSNVAVGGTVYVAQANALGAEGLGKTLRKACSNPIDTLSKHHARLFSLPHGLIADDILKGWIQDALPKKLKGSPYSTQAGLFSFGKIDAGTQLLLDSLPDDISGTAADFGCGPGLLTAKLLAYPNIKAVHAIDTDWRAVELCKANCLNDPLLTTHWADARQKITNLPGLDVAVVNPPFHDDDGEDKSLGETIVQTALSQLKKNGRLFMVANSHLPYERILPNAIKLADENGFKVLRWMA